MNITLLEHEDNSIDFVDQLKHGKCHFVSVAMPGLTFASHYIEFAGGFNVRHRNDFMMTINHARETGTLYPKVNITLLPSPLASYGGFDTNEYNEGDYYSEEEVVAHLLDAFKANSMYIKAKTMYFDFRNLCVSEKHYVACLQAAVNRLNSVNLPEVITWKPK